MKDAEADIALLNTVFAFLVDNRDVAVEFCACLLMNVGNKGVEREKASSNLRPSCSLPCAMPTTNVNRKALPTHAAP